ncbi:MAG TPA: hypothetical protein VIG72_12230 [Pontibacter sp.]
MKKLQVLLLVLYCSLSALSLHAYTLPDTTATTLQLYAAEPDNAPIAHLSLEIKLNGAEAVQQLDKVLLPPFVQRLPAKLYQPALTSETIVSVPCHTLKDTGLHTIFTAGP